MDRTAWIAVALCIIGLVVWEVYSFKQVRPHPVTASATASATATATVSPFPASPASSSSITAPSPAASATPATSAQPSAMATPSFAEASETIRNSDLELKLTNRGGGIAKAGLLNHRAEENSRVTLNSEEHPPIGAIVTDPNAPQFPEYKMRREGDALFFEATSPEGITIRKRFAFAGNEKKDNYIARLDLEFRNDGTGPYVNPGYFVE